jgi:hypothetical protein
VTETPYRPNSPTVTLHAKEQQLSKLVDLAEIVFHSTDVFRAVFLSHLPVLARCEHPRYGLVLLARHQSVLPVGDEVRPAFPEAHIVFECANVYLEPFSTFRPEWPLLQKIFGVRDRSVDHALELFYIDARAI